MSNPIYFVSGLVGPSGLNFIQRDKYFPDAFNNEFTFIPNSKTKMFFIEAWSGGGGGAGCSSIVDSLTTAPIGSMMLSLGSGGGAGGYCNAWIPYNYSTGPHEFMLTVGRGGDAGNNTVGGDGGETNFFPVGETDPANYYVQITGGKGGSSFVVNLNDGHNPLVGMGAISEGGKSGVKSDYVDDSYGFKGCSGKPGTFHYHATPKMLVFKSGKGGVPMYNSEKAGAEIEGYYQTDEVTIAVNSNGYTDAMNADDQWGAGGAGGFALTPGGQAYLGGKGGKGANGAFIITQFGRE